MGTTIPVSTAARLQPGWIWVKSWQGQVILLFSQDWLWGLHSPPFNDYWLNFPPEHSGQYLKLTSQSHLVVRLRMFTRSTITFLPLTLPLTALSGPYNCWDFLFSPLFIELARTQTQAHPVPASTTPYGTKLI
jgi:hypothetical protein